MSKKFYKTFLSYYCVEGNNVKALFLSTKTGFYSVRTKMTLKEWRSSMEEDLEKELKEIPEEEFKTEVKKIIRSLINII